MAPPHPTMPSDHDQPAVLRLIGNTPLVQVTRFDTGPCTLFLKLESQNPGGSIKDRIGLAMIDAAERDGRLQAGGTVVEATAGNTGLGLALVARAKGYRVVLVVPDKMSTEKVLHLKALGAEVHVTRSDVGKGHPDYYQDRAASLAATIAGSSGTLTGLTRYFRGVQPELAFVLADPVGSILAEYTRSGTIGAAGSWAV